MDRRSFVQGAAATGMIASGYFTEAQSEEKKRISPNDKITVCVTGVRGRGNNLLKTFSSIPDVNVKYVCDLDTSILGSRADEVRNRTGKNPERITDFRKAIDDKTVDALVLGTPDHWHALPTIHACMSGKDVYVEKPDGHNIIEGQTMVAAAKKHKRIVQLGTQARSGQLHQACEDYVLKGDLGKVRFAKAWESSKQGAIGPVPDSAPPKSVDYDFWLGPAPKKAFNRYRFHGNWRWFFDYGSGDLGNDGVHRLDNARRLLAAAVKAQKETLASIPHTVSAHGGKYYFKDMQEWPDTLMATYDYGGYLMTYEMRIWTRYPLHGESEGAAVYGENGYVVLGNRRWRAFDNRGRLITEEKGSYNDLGHARNFLDCMRSRKRPAADLETIGHPSSLLCHLGNAAWRAGRSLRFDTKTYAFKGDKEANQFLTRPVYRKPWVLPKISEL